MRVEGKSAFEGGCKIIYSGALEHQVCRHTFLSSVSSGVNEQVLLLRTVNFNLIGSQAMPMTELGSIGSAARPLVLRISLHLSHVPPELCGYVSTGFSGTVAIDIAGGAYTSTFHPKLPPAFTAAFLGSLIFSPSRINGFLHMVAFCLMTTGILGIQLLGVGSWIDDAFCGEALVATVALSGFTQILKIQARKDV